MRSISTILAIISAAAIVAVLTLVAPSRARAEHRLSPEALDALVAGVCLYSDATVERVLAASDDPAAVHAASRFISEPGDAPRGLPAAVTYLLGHDPELLRQLDRHLPLTARLGLAAREQPDDVWRAIERGRDDYARAVSHGTIAHGEPNRPRAAPAGDWFMLPSAAKVAADKEAARQAQATPREQQTEHLEAARVAMVQSWHRLDAQRKKSSTGAAVRTSSAWNMNDLIDHSFWSGAGGFPSFPSLPH